MSESVKESSQQEIVKTGHLVSISKMEEDGQGTAKFSICTEEDMDKDGDIFKAGSLRMEREKATMVSFQHNSEPAGVWTMSREGNNVMANVEFLDTDAGQNTRKYLEKMGDSAQFSFRARSKEWNWNDDTDYGRIYHSATVYEASPVMVGAGNNTKLETIKSREVDKLSKEVEAQAADAEVQKETVNTLKSIQESQSELNTTLTEKLTEIGETMVAVKDSVKPKEEKSDPMIFNTAKYYGVEKPVNDLAKMLFDDEFKSKLNNGGDFYVKKDVPVDLVKASINSFGTITPLPAFPAIQKPVEALDAMYVMPTMTEVVRRRVIARTLPAPHTRGTTPTNIADATSGTGVATADFPMQTVAAAVPISRLSAMADASVMSAYTEMGVEDARVILQSQAISGDGSSPNLHGIITQVDDVAGYVDTALTGDAKKGILTGIHGLNQAILKVRERAGGMSATHVLAGAADCGKIVSSLQNLRQWLDGTGRPGYLGNVLQAGVILTPDLPANTMVVASLGSPRNHMIGMMGGVRVNVSYETLLRSDEVLLTFVFYAANVVQQLGSFQIIKATNFLEAE